MAELKFINYKSRSSRLLRKLMEKRMSQIARKEEGSSRISKTVPQLRYELDLITMELMEREMTKIPNQQDDNGETAYE